MTAQVQTTGTLRSRVVLAILIVVFGILAGAFSFAALLLVCGIGTCPANGQLNGFSYVTGHVVAGYQGSWLVRRLSASNMVMPCLAAVAV